MHHNPGIPHALFAILEDLGRLTRDGLVARVVLLINHVLASEPAAVSRLLPHAYRTIHFQVVAEPPMPNLDWLPPLALRITPAGLVEVVNAIDGACGDGGGDEASSGLSLTFNVANAVREGLTGAGAHRGVTLHGRADFAADVSWVLDNVRWDIAAELARWLPPAAAQPMAALLNTGAGTVVGLVQVAAGWVASALTEKRP